MDRLMDDGSVIHYAHPTEHVPLCIVVGTCAMRNTECRAVRSPEGTDCPECLDELRAQLLRRR